MINWSLERAPVTVKHLIWVQMVCLISDFGQFWAVLIFLLLLLFKVVLISIWSITVSCHWIFCSISYGFVRFQTVVSHFIWFHLILTVPSISIVSLIFLSVFVQFQPVIETGSLNLSSRQNILQTPKICLSFYLIIHFFPSFHRTILLEMVLLQMS